MGRNDQFEKTCPSNLQNKSWKGTTERHSKYKKREFLKYLSYSGNYIYYIYIYIYIYIHITYNVYIYIYI